MDHLLVTGIAAPMWTAGWTTRFGSLAVVAGKGTMVEYVLWLQWPHVLACREVSAGDEECRGEELGSKEAGPIAG